MTLDHLRIPMQERFYEGGRLALPFVTVMLRRGAHATKPLQALVDTGCGRTLVSIDVAEELGFDADELDALPMVPAHGLGGITQTRVASVDLELRGSYPWASLKLPGARVGFTRAMPAGMMLLLGHDDVLQRLSLVVRNHPPRREFVLRFPPGR